MKKTKKLAALFLALMMALSCMAMPAMAHGHDDGVSPQGLVVPTTQTCSICGETLFWVYSEEGGKRDLRCLNCYKGQ